MNRWIGFCSFNVKSTSHPKATNSKARSATVCRWDFNRQPQSLWRRKWAIGTGPPFSARIIKCWWWNVGQWKLFWWFRHIFRRGISDDSSSDGDIDINVSRRPRQQDSYFPFPSKIFFLLYSYVHNISRPKVIFF